MINIRLSLNKKIKEWGGHIGYCIRPSERGKGYNKINLYLGLGVLDKHDEEVALLDAYLDNPASWKTMEVLGGVKIKEYFEENDNRKLVKYSINIKKCLEDHKDTYKKYISYKSKNIKH